MKKNVFPLALAVAMIGFAACNNADNSTSSTDSMSTTTTTDTGAEMASTTSEPNGFATDKSYVDLKTGKTIKIKKDEKTGHAVNQENNEMVYFYYDPASSDTFDMSGRWVNDALTKGTDGNWTVDESRLKQKTQRDGDIKIKDEENDTKMKIDADGNNDKMKSPDSKQKYDNKDGSYKDKTNGEKTKVNDEGETKSKQ